jgi:Flp pilus assembly protein TadG
MRSLRHRRGHNADEGVLSLEPRSTRTTLPSQRRAGDTGAAAVEFALLVPLLLLFVAGILGLGLYLWGQQSANFGAREGARLAAVGVNNCTTWANQTKARSGAITSPYAVTLSYSPSATVGSTITVTLKYKNNGPANSLLAAATSLFPGGALQLPSDSTATAQSRAEVIGSVTSCP